MNTPKRNSEKLVLPGAPQAPDFKKEYFASITSFVATEKGTYEMWVEMYGEEEAARRWRKITDDPVPTGMDITRKAA